MLIQRFGYIYKRIMDARVALITPKAPKFIQNINLPLLQARGKIECINWTSLMNKVTLYTLIQAKA